MAETLWSQDYFGKGELSPLLYARTSLKAYHQALKTAKNIICLPQGAAAKRFGLNNLFEVPDEIDYTQIYFSAFQYLDECTYLVIFVADKVYIYLEGTLQNTISSTGIAASEISLIDHTVLDNLFRITTGIYRPKQIVRSASTPDTITAFSSDTLTLNVGITPVGTIVPIKFATTGSLPTTSPQILETRIYFAKAITATTISIYPTSLDAYNNTNRFTISSGGTSSTVIPQNTWSLANVEFKNQPTYDFGNFTLTGRTYTPATTTGTYIDLTASTAFFTAAMVNGIFEGNGGIARIVAITSTTVAKINIIRPFLDASAIKGNAVTLTQPAWTESNSISITGGWPRKCSSYQSRAVFANSDALPNGVWLSSINEYNDFDDSETNDDNAISHYPTSDRSNFINYIKPYRTLTFHTNSGVYSTSIGTTTAITPNNFYLTLQESTVAQKCEPIGIDNQLIVISGNDVYGLIWDGYNVSYTSDNVSIYNTHLVTNPVDLAPFVDTTHIGSRYAFIVNEDGTLAILQTILSQEIIGITKAELEQSYGNAYFRGVTSNETGRAWFLIEREIAEAITAASLSTYTPTPPATGTDIFTATSHGMTVDLVTAVKFATTGTLLTSVPQIAEDTYYWAVAIDANTFYCYTTHEDATNDENRIIVTEIPANNTVEPWPLTTKMYVEELDFDMEVDGSSYSGSAVSTISGYSMFNAQNILMNGDGNKFQTTVVDGNINFEAHGEPVEVSEAQFGFGIHVQLTPLGLAIPTGGSTETVNLVEPKHVRFISLFLADTIGGTVSQLGYQFPIIPNTFSEVGIGIRPSPFTGYWQFGSYAGWDDINQPLFTIDHTEPFDFKLTGIFYKVDF